ncbi:MAG: type I-E CRISPR-associated protein Cse1/CasA, partial [Desulfomonilaceae bacterium]
MYNLIETPWIPVKTSSGVVSKIEPWRLTEHIRQDPIERLYAARPDFNAALVQFLIGLVQTTMPPEDEDDWLERLEKPPKPEVLRKNFSDWSQAFNLHGASPLFMQDFDELTGENKSVSGLLIESPGEKTIEDNKDHFIKRDTVNKLCPSCAATALLTLQTNAPSGGAGHRTSIRGGGPLSTILVDVNQPLWNTISLNTLPKNLFERNVGGNPDLVTASDIFPWMAKTRVSDSKAGKDTTP